MGEEVEPGQPAGANVKVLKNGALADTKTGRIVANPGGGKSAITPAVSSDMLKLRAEKYRQAAVAGLGRVPGGPGSPVAAWGWLIEKQAALAADIEKGRSSTEAARFVGSAIGVIGGPKAAEAGQPGPDGVIPGAILRGLLADLRLLRDQMGEDNQTD